MAKITDDELTKLKAAHGKVLVLETAPDTAEGDEAPGDTWVFKSPKRADWMAHKHLTTKSIAGDASGVLANVQLARACLVWPKSEDFDALVEMAPAIADGMGAELVGTFRGGLQLRASKSG